MATKEIKRNKVTIDADGQSVGRVATQVVRLLQGKHKAAYEPQADHGDFVEIRNAAKVKVTGKKMEQKEYFHYSGYPGGLRRTPLKEVMSKSPALAIRTAVKRMLPKNRLQVGRMKRLTVHND
ncbi:MAG: 50S ribosomal protein L13 [Patescibacteria group bacterium]|nr:50S ribosomal protein L13 [Patescibacteria group bacterium]